MRSDHLIRRATSDRLPCQVVCVQASARRLPIDGVARGERQELTGWVAEAWRYQKGEVVRRVVRSGPDVPSFWAELDRALHKGTLTWVFSHDAYRVMTLLGFWGMLERGAVSLYGRDERDEHNGSKRAVPSLCERNAGADGVRPRDDDGGLHPLRGELHGRPEGAHAAGKGLRGSGVGYAVLEDPPTVVQFRRDGRAGLVKWVDVRNYAPLCLSEVRTTDGALAASAGFVRSMLDSIREHRLGALANTAAGQAWTFWRRSHYTHAVHVHCYEPALLVERQAYVGGRCEVFRMGEVEPPVYHLDFRSHYASCYENAALPVSLEWYGEFPGGSCDMGLIDPQCTIADVLIDTDTPDYPVVRRLEGGRHVRALARGEAPPHTRSGCLCVYPVGRFRTVLCGPELSHALERGRVVRVYRAARYRTALALRSLGAALRGLRESCAQRGRADLLAWVKAMQVGIVGRMGMHGRKWVMDSRIEPREPYAAWWTPGEGGVPERWRSLAWETQREVVERDGPESACAVAAWITSLARVKLLGAINAAGREHVYYTDTDSLWCSASGVESVESVGILGRGEPGLLRVVRVHQEVEFYGYKHYRADERHVCAGRPAECVGGDEQPDRYRQRERARGGLNGRETPAVKSVLVDWRRAAPYLHGSVGPGGVVRPLEFWEE